LNTATLSTVYDPPVLLLDGVLVDADGSPLGETSLRIVSRDSEGSSLHSVRQRVTPGPDGSYSLQVDLPLATATVRIVAEVGVDDADHPASDFGIAPGTNQATFNLVDDPPLLGVSGLLLNGDGLPRGDTPVQV